MEEWRPIPGHDGYEASSLGRIRSVDRWIEQERTEGNIYRRFMKGRILRQTHHRYMRVYLGHGVSRTVHCLVMLAFYGTPPLGKEVAHSDGDTTNNHIANLSYKTPIENNADKVIHGTLLRGETHYRSRLTEQDIRAIRQSALSNVALAEHYGMKRDTIYKIRIGRIWSHV